VAATWKSAEELLLQADVEGSDSDVDLGDAIGWEDFREGGFHLVEE
jgi:hypothetical protein